MSKPLTFQSNTADQYPTSNLVVSKEDYLALKGSYTAEVQRRLELENSTSLRNYKSLFTDGRTFGESVQYFEIGQYTKLDGEKNTVPVFVLFPFFTETSPSWSGSSWSVHGVIDVLTDSYRDLQIGRHVRHFNPTSVYVPNAMGMRVAPDPKYGNRTWLNWDFKNGGFVPHGFSQDETGKSAYNAFANKHNVIDNVLRLYWAQQKAVIGIPNEIQDSRVLRVLQGRLDLTISEVKALENADAKAAKEYRKAGKDLPVYDGSPIIVGTIDLTKLDHPIRVEVDLGFAKSDRLVDPDAPNFSNVLGQLFDSAQRGHKLTIK